MADISATSAPLSLTIHPLSQDSAPTTKSFWQDDAPSFIDILDLINPLQHIPIVSNLYQAITGDIPSTGAKVIGGALFGGPVGLLSSVFNSIVQGESGTDISGHLVALLTDDKVASQAAASAYEQTQKLQS